MATNSTGTKTQNGKEKRLTKIGSAWKAKSKEGKNYLQGSLDDGRKFIMFMNERKSKEKSPDFLIYLSEPRGEGQTTAAPKPAPAKKTADFGFDD